MKPRRIPDNVLGFLLAGLVLMTLLPLAAIAGQLGVPHTGPHASIEAFNRAYASNDVETYFDFYAADATVYFFGARQDIAAYHREWTALMQAGGGVELNEMSDLKVQIMPGGDIAIATYFVDNRTRYADGSTTTARAFETDVWQKVDGAWKIISLHYSEIPPPGD